VFLLRSAEKRMPCLGRNPGKSGAESGVVWRSRETNLFENTKHFAEQINCFTKWFVQLDTEYMKSEHRPFSEPVATDSLRLVPIRAHLAESFVSGTADAVPLPSSTSKRLLNSINNLLRMREYINMSDFECQTTRVCLGILSKEFFTVVICKIKVLFKF